MNKLKNGKAPGIDNINSELIKAAKGTLLLEIKELFNKILDSAHYPEIWNHGLIYSIYKNGDTKDPSNYRGITLTSCLGKLFSTVLYKRIERELESHDLLAKEQAGFRKKYITTDKNCC